MAWRLELFDNTNATRIGQLVLVGNPRVVFELEGENTLDFDLSSEDPLFTSMLERKYIRMIDQINPATYHSFIIQKLPKSRVKGSLWRMAVSCEGLKYALMNNILPFKKAFVNITASTALGVLLEGSGFTAGTVNPAASNLKDIEFNCLNSLEALQLLVDTWYYDDGGVRKRYFYRVNENKTVDILTQDNLGTQKHFYVTYDKNIEAMTADSDGQGMANRVYGFGAEGFNINRGNGVAYQYANSENAETASGGAAGYIEDSNGPYLADNDYHNGITIKLLTGAGAGQKRIISDTVASTKRIIPTVDFSPAPDNTTTYLIGYADEGDSMVYNLGAYASDSNPVKRQSILQVMWENVAAWTSGSGVCTFEIVISLLDISDAVLLSITKSMELTYPEDNVYDSEGISLGEITTARKLKIEVKTIDFSGGGTGIPYVQFAWASYRLGANVIYVEDATSQAAYGIVAGKYENQNILDTVNLVETPALDGEYTAGVCKDWIAVGAATLTENTDPDFITHGGKSQKIVSSTFGEGIGQYVNLIANRSYCAYFRIYIDAAATGSVRCGINIPGQSSYADTTGVGWIEITIENFSFSDSGTALISILSRPGGATCYVDAVMIHDGAELHDFVAGDSADQLYNETNNDLQQRKNPKVSYSLDLLDLYRTDPDKYAEENFIVGDRIRVVDPELNIDAYYPVSRKAFPLSSPQSCQVRLGEKGDPYRKSLLKLMSMTANQGRTL